MSELLKTISLIMDLFVLIVNLDILRKEFLLIPYKWKIKYSIILMVVSTLFFTVGKVLEVYY